MLDLLQIVDSAFPTGAYVHSCGLEWLLERPQVARLGSLMEKAQLIGDGGPASSEREVPDWELLLEHALDTRLRQQLGRCELVALAWAYRAANDPELAAVDRLLHASLLPRESRQASAQVGRRFTQAAELIFQGLPRWSLPHHHYPVVFGATAAALRIDLRLAAQAFSLQSLRGCLSAVQRLAPLGQFAAQQMLRAKRPLMEAIVDAALDLELDEMTTFAPLLDVAAMAHERCAVRLFVS